MKIICVTGAPGADVSKVADIFFAAGAQAAQALRQEPSFSLANWHEKVLAAAVGDRSAPVPVHQPGRFWEQLATNLFLENMRHPLWAWADARSVWMLDFWQQFEPNLHFVLVHTSPQRALAEALVAEREHGADTATLMAAWEAHQKEILRFHHRNPNRTILVDAAECQAAPAALLDACATRWGLDLAPEAVRLPAPTAAAPLVGYLADQLRQTYPDLQVLQQELEASLQVLLPAQAERLAAPDLFAAVDDYRQVRRAAAQAEALALRVESLCGDILNLNGELGQRRQAEAGLLAEHEAAARRTRELDAEVLALKSANAETQGENEQLLVQLHQLQEEMERWYLENKQHSEIRAAKKRSIEELNKKVAQHEVTIAALRTELDAAKANKAAEKEKADALAALATAKKELDVAIKDAASVRKDADAAKRSAKEAQQESELLLVQLHQVQEELEHYFLEHKSAVKQNETFKQRWERMLERNPDYCDYRSLELLGNDDSGARTSWHFTELNAAGRAFPELRFDTVIADGVAAFAFARDGQAPGAPEALESLGTADWMLLPTLCRVLDEALQTQAGSVAQLGETQRSGLRNALAALIGQIARTPAALRFDRIALKREQVNPDYEHLWLQLGNLSLGDKRWPEFEFRLSCANVRPGKFGAAPKLEFPGEAGAVLFDSWFVESHDDFGDKLELRFALPEAMDMSVWDQLSQDDRHMMTRLVAILPRMLSRLEAARPALARPFAEWQQLAKSVQAILALRLGAALRAATPATAPIALPQQAAGRQRKAGSVPKGILK